MSNAMEVFNYGENVFRAVMEDSDEILFVAKDVCECLGIANHRDAVSRLDEDEKADVGISDTSSNGVVQRRTVKMVTESGMYKLIFSSNKEEAKAFQRFVTHEVLPSIRKTGGYGMPNDAMSLIAQSFANQTQMMGMMVELMAKMAERNEKEKNPLEGITISFSTNPKENEDDRNDFIDAVARYLMENPEGKTQGQVVSDVPAPVGNSTKIRWLKQYVGKVWTLEISLGNRYVYRMI